MLQVTVGKNLRIRGLTVPQRGDLTKMLTQENPAYALRKRKRQPTYGVDKYLEHFIHDSDGSLVVPRGFEKELRAYLGDKGIAPDWHINRTFADPIDFGTWSGPVPREYQQPAIAAAAKEGGVLVAPAGSGKTLMGMAVVQLWRQPTLWLTHTLDLLNQSKRVAEAMLEDVGRVGVIGGGTVELGDGKLIVATVQTLKSQPELIAMLDQFIGAIVVDEAHHMPASNFIETVGQFSAQYVLGLTATPDRKDGLQRKMFLGLGPICHEVQRDGMYEAGAIILPKVQFVYTQFGALNEDVYDEDRVTTSFVDGAGEDLDYAKLTDDLYADRARRDLILDKVLESARVVSRDNGTVIVLSQGIRYLRELEEEFRERFPLIPAAAIHGSISQTTYRKVTRSDHVQQGDPGVVVRRDGLYIRQQMYTEAEAVRWQISPREREATLQRVMERRVTVLFASFSLVKEGLDVPHLYHGHLITPMRGDAQGTRSGAGVEQGMGRIMRPDPKNPQKEAVWFDYVDYNVGVFADQYQSRRSVYRRLGLQLPKKPRKKKDQDVVDFLANGGPFMDLPI